MRIVLSALAVVVVAVSACGGTAEPRSIRADASTIDGTWRATGEVVGSSEVWTLSVSGTSVSGTGTWSAEACCGGTAKISGIISGDTLHLSVLHLKTVPSGDPQPVDPVAVDAVLSSQTDLAVTVLGASQPVHFVKASTP